MAQRYSRGRKSGRQYPVFAIAPLLAAAVGCHRGLAQARLNEPASYTAPPAVAPPRHRAGCRELEPVGTPIAPARHGYFSAVYAALVEESDQQQPDFLMVRLGTPHAEAAI